MTAATLLPNNATPLERALEATQSRLGDVPTPLRDLWDPATCPLELLPWLAWALSIDSWNADWPETIKRARVAGAIAIQRRKGTAGSVRAVVEAYGAAIGIREWWETSPPGTPHTFDLIITGGSAELIDDVVADVTLTKPLRSQFTFIQGLESTGAIGVAGGFRPVIYARLNGLAVAA